MSVTEMQRLVQYVTDSQGTQTGVVVPIGLWEKILGSLDSGDLLPMDDDDSKEKILADLKEAMQSTRAGEFFPIDQLWEKVYE
jgi:hypothetical protein